MDDSRSFAVVGAGAMGAMFGARLAAAGFDVTLFDPWEEHVAQIQANGLKVLGGSGETTVRLPAYVSACPDKAYDYAIIFTKNQHTEDAINRFKPVFGPKTYVVSLQNGIGGMEILPHYFARERIIVGVTTCSSDLEGPGRVRPGGGGTTYVAPLHAGSPEGAQGFASILRTCGLQTAVSEQTLGLVWEKLAFNAAINPLCALTRMSAGEAERHPYGKRLIRLIVEEVASVAHRAGIQLNSKQVLENLYQACRPEHSGHHLPSMLQHVLNGQSTEIEAINGAVIRLAEQLQVDVPYNRIVYQLVKMTEEHYLRPGQAGQAGQP